MGWRYTVAELASVVGGEFSGPVTETAFFSGVSTDTRSIEPGQAFFALRGERFDGSRFIVEALRNEAAIAVTSEIGEGPRLLVADPLEALQRFSAYHRKQHAMPLLAITGSCGKTSAKDFTSAVLSTKYRVEKTRGNLNNEIGCPLSLLRLEAGVEFAVIEMGANHAGEIAGLCELARPTESAVTIVAPAHLEGFGSVEGVAAAKGEIVEALGEGGCFYVNVDDPWCLRMTANFQGEQIRFGSTGDVALKSCSFDEQGEMMLDVSPVGRLQLPLPVRAQATNVLLAIAAGLRHGVTEFEGPLREACRESSRFRIERVGPLEVLDDSYNANPASMEAALAALSERPGRGARIAALGEMLELGNEAPRLHWALGEAAAQHGIDRLFVRGPHSREVAEAAKLGGVSEVLKTEDHRAIAQAIWSGARTGDILLIKGSRGMRMEGVLEGLRELHEAKTPHAD